MQWTTGRVSWSSKLPLREVLLQGGVNLFQGEFSTPTGWLDKPLEFTHARSRRGNAWRCAKIPGSMRKQVVPLRVYCGHFVRALRELCVKMRAQRAKRAKTRLHAMFTPRCVLQKWHALPRSIACHCGDTMRASVNVAILCRIGRPRIATASEIDTEGRGI